MNNTVQNPFLIQTAKDYALPYHEVERIYNLYTKDAIGFFDALEEAIKIRTNIGTPKFKSC